MSNRLKVVIILLLMLVVAFSIFYVNGGLSIFDKKDSHSSPDNLVIDSNNLQRDYYNQMQEEQEAYLRELGYYDESLIDFNDESESNYKPSYNLDWEVVSFNKDSQAENMLFFSGIIKNTGNEDIEAGTTWRVDYGDGNYEEGVIGQTIIVGNTYNIATMFNSYEEAGEYEATLMVDYDNSIDESNENNNQMSIIINI